MTCNNCSNTSCHEQQEEYEEYVPNKEYPIGGFFKIGNEVFKVVQVDCGSCLNCDFYTTSCPKYVKCSGRDRIDVDDDVAFILYDTLEDNE